MKRFQQNIRKVVPYVPGDQPDFPDMIKLNTNENPYPPAPEVQEVLAKSNAEQMRLYPDPTAHQLNAAIAEAYGVEEAQVFTGVGSDDVLAMIFQTFFNSDLPILFPDITYAFYPVWCDLFRIPYEVQPLNEKLEIVPEDYYKPNGGIVFPNPNAPTGIRNPFLPQGGHVPLHQRSDTGPDSGYSRYSQRQWCSWWHTSWSHSTRFRSCGSH